MQKKNKQKSLKPKKAAKIKAKNSKKLVIEHGARITKPGSSIENKTGSWRVMKPVKDDSKCKNCGRCWMFCPEMAIDENFNINYDYCKGCGICAKECPFGAIVMAKENK